MIKLQLRTGIPIVFLISNGNVLKKEVSDNSDENSVVKVTSSFAYNLANECVTEVHNNGTGYNYEYSYTYTPDGNVLESSLSKKEKRIKTIYTYDRLNRLTSEEQQEYNKGDLIDEFKDVYSFDDYNNILKKVHAEDDTTKNSTVVSTYDKTRLLTQTETDSENNQSSQMSYTYDDNGNMSSKVLVKGENTTETQFSYDGFDRTTGIKIGDVTTSFDYNTDSDRVSKTTNGKTTEAILDNGSVSADLIDATLKVFSDDNSVFCQNGVFAYNVINTKGDIIALAGSNGIDYNYNAYGTELYNCSSANPIGYRNYYYDSETGLYYLKARYYDPTTGQFTQEDTVQDDNLQYNLYGYCSANPVLYTDPSGHTLRIYGKKATRKKILNCIVKLTGLRVWNIKSTLMSKRRDSSNDFDTISRDKILTGREVNDIYGKSYRLLREIIKHPALVYIKVTSNDSFCDPHNKNCITTGTNSTVLINLSKQKSTYVQKNGSGKTVIEKIPYEISLAHELTHALRNAKGDSLEHTRANFCKYKFKLPNGKIQTEYAHKDELEVTGIGIYYSNYEYNENKFRSEHGYKKRVSYCGF